MRAARASLRAWLRGEPSSCAEAFVAQHAASSRHIDSIALRLNFLIRIIFFFDGYLNMLYTRWTPNLVGPIHIFVFFFSSG